MINERNLHHLESTLEKCILLMKYICLWIFSITHLWWNLPDKYAKKLCIFHNYVWKIDTCSRFDGGSRGCLFVLGSFRMCRMSYARRSCEFTHKLNLSNCTTSRVCYICGIVTHACHISPFVFSFFSLSEIWKFKMLVNDDVKCVEKCVSSLDSFVRSSFMSTM